MNLVGASPKPRLVGMEELPGKANYFIGRDRTRWHANVPMFAQVRYHDLYPGIDLTVSGDHRYLDFAFVVSPGADPNRIVLAWQGVDTLAVGKPVFSQSLDGARGGSAGRYVRKGAQQLGIEVTAYDTSRPLVIGGSIPLSSVPRR